MTFSLTVSLFLLVESVIVDNSRVLIYLFLNKRACIMTWELKLYLSCWILV